MNYEVGDIITYRTFGGFYRTVEVECKEPNIKNGRPGFDGVIIEGGNPGQGVWGYDDQIVSVDTDRRSEVEKWNAALATSNDEFIERVRIEALDSIHARIMNDDAEYAAAGWTPDE